MAGLLVHEWIEHSGGAEKVLDAMVNAFPEADVFALWNDAPARYAGRSIQESWISRTPLRRHKALSLPFQLPTWRTLPAGNSYDWMVISSHLFAHHARLPRQPDVPKYVYAHTPARYIWVPELDERGTAPHIRLASAVLRPLDRRRAQEAHRIAANSQFTRERIQQAWGRDAEVMYPPVDVDRIISTADWTTRLSNEEGEILDSLPQDFLLGASRMVRYKRLDLVIEAGEATGAPVVLAGAGPLWGALKERSIRSSTRVDMVSRPSDALLFALYQRARAFVFPAVEDFGIMPVEAMAAGVPVIVPSIGGAAESVLATEGGVVLQDFSADSWSAAITAIDAINRDVLPERTQRFSNASFRATLIQWLGDSSFEPPAQSRAKE